MSDAEALFSLIRGRRSIRRFKPDPVPEDTIRRVIEVACWSPSASWKRKPSRCGWASPLPRLPSRPRLY